MSAEAKNIRLEGHVLAALQEAAQRQQKTLDEMASEAVMEGLRAERLNRVQALLAKGHRHGAATGIPKNQVVDLIHTDRKERRRAR
jgi:hypothetical protein